MLSVEDAAKAMGMKVASIVDVFEVADGSLVVTSEGAQTLIDADGRCSAVLPRREVLNLVGRGSVKRHVPDPGPDLTPTDPGVTIPPPAGEDAPKPIRVAATVGPAKAPKRP